MRRAFIRPATTLRQPANESSIHLSSYDAETAGQRAEQLANAPAGSAPADSAPADESSPAPPQKQGRGKKKKGWASLVGALGGPWERGGLRATMRAEVRFQVLRAELQKKRRDEELYAGLYDYPIKGMAVGPGKQEVNQEAAADAPPSIDVVRP